MVESVHKTLIFALGTIFLVLLSTTMPSAHAITKIWMQDTTSGGSGLSTYQGRPINAENVTSTSSLVGKSIDTISMQLKKIGSPTGTAQVGIFYANLTTKKLFSNVTASTISTSYTNYTYSLPDWDHTYKIAVGDKIGIKFSGGDTSNYISAMRDTNTADPFDGTNSYQVYYDNATLNKWVVINTNYDQYMTLSLTDSTPPGITINGDNPMSITRCTNYVDAGASALDYIDGNRTGNIIKNNPVNKTLAGTYLVTYNVNDTLGNNAVQANRTVNVIAPGTIRMQDTTSGGSGLSTYQGRPINAENVTGTSALVGKSIDTISMQLKKIGSPTGTAQVGVFYTNQTTKKLFSNVDVTNISAASYTNYTYAMPCGQTYTIQSGDRIGFKFSGGDASNYIAAMRDTNPADPFDGTNSYQVYYDNATQKKWVVVNNTYDQYMTLSLTNQTKLGISAPKDIFTFSTTSSAVVSSLGTPQLYPASNDTSTPTYTNNHPSTTYSLGSTIVTWTATDQYGKTAKANQTVAVVKDPNRSANNKVALITFDDGRLGQFTLGKPVLDKYGVKATFYIIGNDPSGVGCSISPSVEGSCMNWADIRVLQSQGHDIEGHTMNHVHLDQSSNATLQFELSDVINAIQGNVSGTHVTQMAMPFTGGYNNGTVIQWISKYYLMSRGNNELTAMYLHCNGPGGQTDCHVIYNPDKTTNNYHRYNIVAKNHNNFDFNATAFERNNTKIFQEFVNQVNNATTNTSANTTQIPILYYHHIVIDNNLIVTSSHWGTNANLFDNEMKYLRDNNFKIRTSPHLKYNNSTNLFYFNN